MTKLNETDTKELLEIHSTLLKEHFRDIEDLEDRVKNIEETFKDIFGREEDESKETETKDDVEKELLEIHSTILKERFREDQEDYDEVVDNILKNVDIVEVIGVFVKLHKVGNKVDKDKVRYYIGLCPFHEEKTPSFAVDSMKQTFHCFGCGVSGNAFSFLLGMKVPFNQALAYLMVERKSYNDLLDLLEASVKNDK